MKKIILFILLIFVVSCSIDDPVSDTGSPTIIKVEKSNVRVADTVKIDGKYFGSKNQLSFLILDSIKILSSSCLKWQENEIWFIIPDTAVSGKLRVVANSDTSNSIDIDVNPLPVFEFVEIYPEGFVMGSLTGNIDEKPVELVYITKNFFMTTTEITQKLYRIVTRSNPSSEIGDNLPVNNIEWLDAVIFCNKLSKMQDLDTAYRISGADVLWDTNSNGWRLPTEAEWELSCRAGNTSDFYNTNLSDIAWYSDNSGYRMKPVASKLPNDYGLYDMSGNLWEWCYDYYSNNYYGNRNVFNPRGPKSGDRRVIRGGAFDQGTYFARSSNRSRPENVNGNIGFRIVRNKVN